MNIEYYENYEKELNAGLKKQAKKSIALFIKSFKDEDEVRSWVWEYLPQLGGNTHGCIRHEIFVNLVYPVLKKGFDSNDYESTLWLGKLVQNIYQAKGVCEEFESLTEMDFYRKCHDIDPDNNEGKKLLLNHILGWLSQCEHEWPRGILYGMDGATIEQCKDIREEANFALSLTTKPSHKEFIKQFLDKLSQYEQRLNTLVQSASGNSAAD